MVVGEELGRVDAEDGGDGGGSGGVRGVSEGGLVWGGRVGGGGKGWGGEAEVVVEVGLGTEAEGDDEDGAMGVDSRFGQG